MPDNITLSRNLPAQWVLSVKVPGR